MKLRHWQSECVTLATNTFTNTNSPHLKKHFLALATPGAGKTFMAATLAHDLYELGLIDLVLCFSPSSIVSSDFSDTLSIKFNCAFDGKLGSLGDSFTYQKLSTLDAHTWQLFERFKVFVIFDEIHHCAGSSSHDANAWGAPIIEIIKEKAIYSLALTGTPWRSDALPIALSEYCEDNQIKCDYTYGLKQAIMDDVCRFPNVIAIDNDKIVVSSEEDDKSTYTSFSALLNEKAISYSQVVANETVIEQVLYRAVAKLKELRQHNSHAGGLIVASSISHAESIQRVMRNSFSKTATIVTTNEIKPADKIKAFRENDHEWLISVGMVSEGTNIPRLQVCCNLTNVTTEMYFRQIFGRILRKTSSPNNNAFMFMPAEPKLISYAQRMVEDIPSELRSVKIVSMHEPIITDIDELTVDTNTTNINQRNEKKLILIESTVASIDDQMSKSTSKITGLNTSHLTEVLADNNLMQNEAAYQSQIPKVMGIIGKYKQEHLKIHDLEPLIISNEVWASNSL